MKGSKVANIKFNPNKQKIVECEACGAQLVVGKFSKKNQTCKTANYFPPDSRCIENKDDITDNDAKINFGVNLVNEISKLGFELDAKRKFRKKYPIDGGGVYYVYPEFSNPIAGEEPRIEYFSIVMQRVIGVNENFRRFMPLDAASDCELIASEFGVVNTYNSDIGKTKCDKCGAMTDEFGVNMEKNQVLCIKPNNCFKKAFTNNGAESE